MSSWRRTEFAALELQEMATTSSCVRYMPLGGRHFDRWLWWRCCRVWWSLRPSPILELSVWGSAWLYQEKKQITILRRWKKLKCKNNFHSIRSHFFLLVTWHWIYLVQSWNCRLGLWRCKFFTTAVVIDQLPAVVVVGFYILKYKKKNNKQTSNIHFITNVRVSFSNFVIETTHYSQ